MKNSLCAICVSLSLAVVFPIPTATVVFAAQSPTDAPSRSAQLPQVDPEAVNALNKMGNYLRSLTSFEIAGQTTTEDVLDNDEKVQFGGTMDYKIRQPNGFFISESSDRKVRQFYYDGKNFSIYSPRMALYSTIAAPPTILELFKLVYDKYKIEFPLEDLFHWGAGDTRIGELTSAVLVGYAKIDGQDSDQFAFREGNIDWQVWIRRGDSPLPLKLVIVDTSDETMPEYTEVLHWNTSATFSDDTFDFKPPEDAKRISLKKTSH